VARRKDGLNVFYRIADREVFRICDIMCGAALGGARGVSAPPGSRASA